MKKRLLTTLCSLLFVPLFLVGCDRPPEVGWDPRAWDSRVFHLPNSHTITITGAQGGSLNVGYSSRVIYPITEFCYNERFVGMKNTSTINAQNEVAPLEEWYIFDGIEEVVYGPYSSLQEYEKALEVLGVAELSDWIVTVEKRK